MLYSFSTSSVNFFKTYSVKSSSFTVTACLIWTSELICHCVCVCVIEGLLPQAALDSRMGTRLSVAVTQQHPASAQRAILYHAPTQPHHGERHTLRGRLDSSSIRVVFQILYGGKKYSTKIELMEQT